MADDSSQAKPSLGEFVAGMGKLNTESLQRFFEIQGEGMKAFTDANRALLETLRDAKSVAEAAAAQQQFFEAMQQNAQVALAKQLELARRVGEDTKSLFGGLIKRD